MKPNGITANREKHTLTIEWSDGHVSIYPFSLLRNACPCASCRGGHDKMSLKPDPIVFDLLEVDASKSMMKNLEEVGTYAINITWDDGHDYGIYTWDYLRALCPCPQCRE
jgi:DUF971 family protein